MFKERKVSVRDVNMGKDITIISPSNVYECQLGDQVFIGPFVEIQKGVKIGNKTKVQSHAFICELVTIGSNCFIGHGVCFTNDLFSIGGPARGNQSLWKETLIGNNVSIGSNSTILPVMVCNDVVIGAGSVVTKNIDKPGVYCGNPAKFLRDF